MIGLHPAAARLALLTWLLLSLPAFCQQAPVVQLRQPIAFVASPANDHPAVPGCFGRPWQQESLSPVVQLGAAGGPVRWVGGDDPVAEVPHPVISTGYVAGFASDHVGDAGDDGVCGGGLRDSCRTPGCWIRADYLMWWTEDDEIPPLVTSSPLGTPIDDVGVLGLPTTSVRFDGPLFRDLHHGGRLRFGGWADGCRWGFDGALWGIASNATDVWSSAGSPAYARPFTNVDPLVNGQDAQLISYDATLDGAVAVSSSSEILGGELGLLRKLQCCSDLCGFTNSRLDFYAGYRYFKVREGLRISEDLESIAVGGPVAQGTTTELFDDFQTRGEFHGANLGIVSATRYGRWTAEITQRVSFGQLTRSVRIAGETTTTVPGQAPVTRSGGLLAQPTNIGRYEDSEFAILPEIRADLGYQLRDHSKLLIGYTFMYLGELVRPGNALDPTVNGVQLDPNLPFVGPQRPRFAWSDSAFWVMGLNLSLEHRF